MSSHSESTTFCYPKQVNMRKTPAPPTTTSTTTTTVSQAQARSLFMRFFRFFVSYRFPLNWSDMWLWWNKCAEDKTGTNSKSARVNGGTFRQFCSSVLLRLLIDTKIAIYISQHTISFIEILTNVEYWLYPNKSIIFRMDLFLICNELRNLYHKDLSE